MKKIVVLLLLMIVSLAAVLSAQTESGTEMHKKVLECKVCHKCENPTPESPCLRTCPRFASADPDATAEDGPDIIIIDILSDLYVPVVFSHQLHAEMSGFSGGCQICHHHNPSGEILLCEECHPVSAKNSELRRPSLKGAYHRQCLGCHREWSHDTKCAICHALKSSLRESDDLQDDTDIIGVEHPLIPEPDKIIYETDSEEGELVTFYHGEHVNLFEFKCVDCHKKENCRKCHDMAAARSTVMTKSATSVTVENEEKNRHQRCFTCHEETKCKVCHSQVEKGRFNHLVSSGWTLSQFHQKLSCRNCHAGMNKSKKLNRKCSTCHADWNPENFKHGITGLILDENHFENDCEECHKEQNYTASPSCDNCHDEEISFPQNIPGERRK